MCVFDDWSIENKTETEDECLGEFEFWSCQSSTRQCQRICENKGFVILFCI